jgi:excisionase family DNA binding protein
MTKEEQQYFNIEDIALIVNKEKWTVWNYIKDGKLKGVKFGGQWKVSREELERYLGHPVTCGQPSKEFYKTRDVADILGYDLWTIRRYINEGINGLKLKARKINNTWLIHKTDLEEFKILRWGECTDNKYDNTNTAGFNKQLDSVIDKEQEK